MKKLVLGDKGKWESTYVKSFNLNILFTCNRCFSVLLQLSLLIQFLLSFFPLTISKQSSNKYTTEAQHLFVPTNATVYNTVIILKKNNCTSGLWCMQLVYFYIVLYLDLLHGRFHVSLWRVLKVSVVVYFYFYFSGHSEAMEAMVHRTQGKI